MAHYSTACKADGIGCDGYDYDYGFPPPCDCGCHSDYAPLFVTEDHVHDYHIDKDVYRVRTDAEVAAYFFGRDPITDSNGVVWVVTEQYR